MFQLSIRGAAIWINPFVGILTIIALWPVAILFMHLRIALRTLKIIPKYAMYQVRHRRRFKTHVLHTSSCLHTSWWTVTFATHIYEAVGKHF